MKNLGRIVLFILFLISPPFLNAMPAGLEEIKTIGDERDDYTFLALTGAVLSKNKDIYVLDGRGFFIAQYDFLIRACNFSVSPKKGTY